MDFSDLIPSGASEPATQPDSLSFDDLIPKRESTASALSRGLARNVDLTGQFAGSVLESAGGALGIESLEGYGREMAAQNRAELAAAAPSMTTSDIQGVGSAGSFVAEKLGESATPMLTSIGAAAAAGAVAGSVAPGLGTVAGALVAGGAAALANLPYMFGSMRERQKDADIAAGRKIEVDEQAALFAAVPASVLDTVSDLFLVGKFGRFLKPLTENTGLFTRVISNTATGAMVEAPTELGQTLIERFQAGLSLTDEEAQNEYWEAAVAGGLVGGTVSGAMSIPKPGAKPDTAPKVEKIPDAGSTAEQALALSGDPLPDANAPPTGKTAPKATTTTQISDEELAALARTKVQSMRAQARTAPSPALSQDLTPEQRMEADKAAAAELGSTATPDPTAVPPAPPVVDEVTPEVTVDETAPVVDDTALNEGVPGQVTSGDEIPTVPEAPEQIEAQMKALLDPKNERGVVFAPYGGIMPALPKGTIARVERKDGVLFFNWRKKIDGKLLTKERVKVYDEDGKRNELLGLGPLNKAEVAAQGPVDLAVVERNPDGVAVKEAAATEATVPEQAAAIEALAPEGNTVEVLPAEVVVAERQAQPRFVVDATTGKRQFIRPLSAEQQRAADEAYDEQAFQAKSAALAKEREAAEGGAKADRKEGVLAQANRGELSAEEEITVRVNAKQAKKNPKIAKGKLERFRAAAGLFAEMAPTASENIRSLADVAAVFQRFKETVAEANKRGLKIVARARVSDEMPNSLAWLVQMSKFAGKADAFAKATTATRTEMMGEVLDFVANEQILLATGDSTPIREDRKRTADAIAAAKRGMDVAEVSDTAAEEEVGDETVDKVVRSAADEFSDDDVQDDLSAAALTIDETSDSDQSDDDDDGYMQPAADDIPVGEDGLPGRERPPVEIEGEAFTAGKTRTAPVEVRKQRKVTRPGRIGGIRRYENAATAEEKEEFRDRLEGISIPFYDRMLTDEIREELSQGYHPESVLAQDVMSLSELTDQVDSDEFRAELVLGGSTLSKLERTLQAAISGAISKSIQKVVGDVKVYVLADADMDLMAGKADGYYRQDGDYIVLRASVLRDPAKLAHIVNHEGAHAAFEHAINASPKVRAQLEAVYDKAARFAQDNGYTGNEYAFKDVHEFLSEAFSNPQFQEFLSTVSITPGERYTMGLRGGARTSAVQDVMSWLKAKLSEILDIEAAFRAAGYKPNSTSALAEAMEIAGRLMEIAPEARARFYASDATQSSAVRKSEGEFTPAEGSTEAKLIDRGLTPREAVIVAGVVNEELGGNATDAELNALVSYIKKPIATPAGAAGATLPPLPPRVTKIVKVKPAPKPLPGRAPKAPPAGGTPPKGPKAAAVLANMAPGPRGAPEATSTTKFKLYATTLDFIDRMYNRYFVDAQGNALSDFTNAAYEFANIVQDVAKVHDLDFADFEDLKKSDPAEAQKIAELVADVQGADVNLGPQANNDHLKGNAKKNIQAKANLPQLQAAYAALSPEGAALFDRMATNYRESFNEYIQSVTYTILENLDTKLSNSDLMRIMQNVVDGKLTDADKLAINDDAIFEQLQKSEMLKKRKGIYFPAQRFGEWVVTTTTKVGNPGITSAVTVKSKQTVPVTTEVDGGTVRFIFDHTVVGARGAVEAKVNAWIASHDLTMTSFMTRFRDRQTGEIVGKGDQDVTRDYDMVYVVQMQNEGVHFFEDRTKAGAFQKQADADVTSGVLTSASTVLPKHVEKTGEVLIANAALDAVMRSFSKNKNLQDHDRKRLEGVLRDAVIMQSVGNRYEKRLLGRKNIIGASDEIGRTAANYGRSVGTAIAQIRSGKARASAMTRMRKIAKDRRSAQDGGIIEQVVNELVQREALDGGPLKNTQALDNLSTINSIDKLASPANWFLNSTQVAMNLLPWLGGEYGNAKAARAILSAYSRVGAAGALKSGAVNLGKSVTSAGKNRLDPEDVVGSIRKNVGLKYDAMFEALIARGDIAADVGIENATQLASGRSPIGQGLVKLDRILRAMPNAIEAINRSVAAVAAYDLAIEKGMSKAEAIDYSAQMIRRTQFRYDEVNKSRLMRDNRALRFFFTFKQYGQGQYQMLAEAVGNAYRGETPEVRWAAGKQLVNMLCVQALTAGVLSVPGIELFKVAVMIGSALGLSDGWEDEVERVRSAMKQAVGLGWEEVLSKGLLSKALGVDLSSRMSWADLITGFPPESGEREDLTKWFANTVLGPQGGMALDWLEGASLLRKGLADGDEKDTIKGLSMLLPVKIGSDIIKAAGGLESGKMNEFDAAKQAIGFRSLRLAREGDATGAEIRAGKKKKKEVNELIADYFDASSKSDILRATAAIREYNARLGEDEREISLNGLKKKKLAEARAN